MVARKDQKRDTNEEISYTFISTDDRACGVHSHRGANTRDTRNTRNTRDPGHYPGAYAYTYP